MCVIGFGHSNVTAGGIEVDAQHGVKYEVRSAAFIDLFLHILVVIVDIQVDVIETRKKSSGAAMRMKASHQGDILILWLDENSLPKRHCFTSLHIWFRTLVGLADLWSTFEQIVELLVSDPLAVSNYHGSLSARTG